MKISFSKACFLVCCILIFLLGFFYYPKWKQTSTEATISWDVAGYYVYLPALFIYNDLAQCRFKDEIIQKYRPLPAFDLVPHSSGNYVMKYSCGQALMFSPFFFVAHLVATASPKYEADGFSYPYQVSVGIGAILFAFLGLWYLRKSLLYYFSEVATGITLLAIVFASNYLDYAAINGAMTHNTLFTVYSLLLYCTIRFYKNPDYANAAMIGILIGLATLTRPTEIISALLPVFWGVAGFKEVKERFGFIKTNRNYFLLAVLLAAIIMSIQVVYWKWVSGEWLVYSYEDEGFSFLHPHLFLCSISYRSGWLVYSPVMLLALFGFLTLYLKWRKIFWPVFIFCALFTWICFSWDMWWYGGSLGQRAMVQSYPVYAFSMASIVSYFISKSFRYRLMLAIFLSFCTWYNLWLTHGCHRGGLYKAGEMTKPYFWKVFGRLKVDERVETLLDNSVLYEGAIADPVLLYENDFDSDTSANATTNDPIDGKSIYLDKDQKFSAEYLIPLPASGKKWIRASADFRIYQKEWTSWKMTQFVLRFYKKGALIQTNQVCAQRIMKDNETKTILLDARIPTQDFDKITLVFWNASGDKKIIIDNLNVICF